MTRSSLLEKFMEKMGANCDLRCVRDPQRNDSEQMDPRVGVKTASDVIDLLIEPKGLLQVI